MKRGCVVAVVLATALGSAAERAGAELYRCKGPDGKTLYTDNKALCPGADAFEPQGEVQEAPGPDARSTPASRDTRADRAEARRLAEESEQGEARRWRQKREDAERRLEEVGQRRAYLGEYVTWCNRGGSVLMRDDAGIKRKIPCTALRAEIATLETEEAQLHQYLEQELPEACRRAGCLPGWLR